MNGIACLYDHAASDSSSRVFHRIFQRLFVSYVFTRVGFNFERLVWEQWRVPEPDAELSDCLHVGWNDASNYEIARSINLKWSLLFTGLFRVG